MGPSDAFLRESLEKHNNVMTHGIELLGIMRKRLKKQGTDFDLQESATRRGKSLWISKGLIE